MKQLSVVGTILLGALAAQGATLPKGVVDRVAAACVLIQSVEGHEASVGSGFFVGPSEVLTNYHVVKNAIEGGAKVRLVMGSTPRTRKVANAAVVAGDEELDLVLLRTDQPSASLLRFANERALRPTQEVWVAGFPLGTKLGVEVSWTAGAISTLRQDPATGELKGVQVDASVNPGNSGGPVVDAQGGVVGVTVAVLKPAVGSGMALAIPCGAAERFLKLARQARRRTAKLPIAGKLPVRYVQLSGGEKAEEIWGTSVSFVLRSTRGTEELAALTLEVTNRRREVIARETLEVGRLEPRAEKALTLRLRRVAFDDVAACRILE